MPYRLTSLAALALAACRAYPAAAPPADPLLRYEPLAVAEAAPGDRVVQQIGPFPDFDGACGEAARERWGRQMAFDTGGDAPEARSEGCFTPAVWETIRAAGAGVSVVVLSGAVIQRGPRCDWNAAPLRAPVVLMIERQRDDASYRLIDVRRAGPRLTFVYTREARCSTGTPPQAAHSLFALPEGVRQIAGVVCPSSEPETTCSGAP